MQRQTLRFPNPNPLRMEPGELIVTYAFAGPDDRRGKRSGSESVKVPVAR